MPATALAGARGAIRAQLGRVLEGLAPEAIDALANETSDGFLAGGDELFHEGEPGDTAYLILSGRLRAMRSDGAGGERVLQEMGPGEFVGEMPLVRPGARAATVRAIRDTHLGVLSSDAFARVTERHPQVLHRVAALLVDRLRAQTGGAAFSRAPVRTVAVAPAGPGAPVGAVAEGLARALGRLGGVRRVDARGFAHARSDQPPIAAVGQPHCAAWLAEQESEGCVLVYEADSDAGEWTQRCLRQADHVVWVAARDRDGAPWLEKTLAESRCAADRSLVSLETGAPLPTRAAFRFALTLRAVADFDRLARLVTGRAVGVVLGGGGARGLAHIGVLRALEELHVPVDAIGGTSAGAAVAALAARGLDAAGTREVCRRQLRSVFDPTVPVVAMLRGRRIAARLAEAVGERSIEELAIPFLSVSTNLSRGAVRVHRSGSLLRAVRASLAIPGILPPVIEDGELLVDGALLDNLPVLAMRELTGGGPVLAVDVGMGFPSAAYADLPDELSGWTALRRRFGGAARDGAMPSIFEILMRSAMVSSIGSAGRAALRDGVDLGIAPPVHDFGLFAFDRVDEIAERGYRAALEPVRVWWEGLRAGTGLG